MRLGAIFSAVAFFMLTASSATALDTNYYTAWFSDEEGASEICPDGVRQHECSGANCDDHTLNCYEPGQFDVGIDTTAARLKKTGYFSDEGANVSNNEGTCSDGQVVVGMECSGSYCDNINLVCAPTDPRAVRGECHWTAAISEEKPNNLSDWWGYQLVGLRCTGNYCGHSAQYVCKVAVPDDPDPTWKWVRACGGIRGECGGSISASVDISTEEAKSYSNEVINSLSTTLESKVSAEFGGMGSEISTSMTDSHSSARTDAGSVVAGMKSTVGHSCSISQSTEVYDIAQMWQIEVTAYIQGRALRVRTCEFTCTQNMAMPTWGPQDDQMPKACGIKRK